MTDRTDSGGESTGAREDRRGDRPLVAHVLFRLDYGGLENGLVNLINRIPANRFRHAVVCIDRYTDFRERIERPDTPVIAIGKKPGFDGAALRRLFRTFRELRPNIVHTRNLAALDALLPAALAGVKRRIHGEHGWDVSDVDGKNIKYRLLRKLHAPLVTEYVAVSEDLRRYLVGQVGVDGSRVHRIYNGVDLERFRPAKDKEPVRRRLFPQLPAEAVLVGCVGRLDAVKGHLDLARAFVQLTKREPALCRTLRLMIVGDGVMRGAVEQCLQEAGVSDRCIMTGNRNDVPDILQCLDVFVQPSLAEGMSNTVLEAMACGLPVVATDVGGNPELVRAGETGDLVPPGDSSALADALVYYARDPTACGTQGAASRKRAAREFSIASMAAVYVSLYEGRRNAASPWQPDEQPAGK